MSIVSRESFVSRYWPLIGCILLLVIYGLSLLGILLRWLYWEITPNLRLPGQIGIMLREDPTFLCLGVSFTICSSGAVVLASLFFRRKSRARHEHTTASYEGSSGKS
jgi:hypothetical protein